MYKTDNYFIYFFVGKHITLKTLLMLLKERNAYDGARSSLQKILHNIGFRWKQSDNRRALYELSHIANSRVKFLKNYVHNMNDEKPSQFVYLDETWIFQRGSDVKTWQDASSSSVKKISGEGKRFEL